MIKSYFYNINTYFFPFYPNHIEWFLFIILRLKEKVSLPIVNNQVYLNKTLNILLLNKLVIIISFIPMILLKVILPLPMVSLDIHIVINEIQDFDYLFM